MTLKKLAINLTVVFLVATFVFIIHFFVNSGLNKSISTGHLVFSYTVNILLACGVIVLIFAFQKKLKNQLGFIFMATSLLKFVFFFFLFYPEYHADGDLSRLEFSTFFIPYAICLITETVILSLFFNRLDNLND